MAICTNSDKAIADSKAMRSIFDLDPNSDYSSWRSSIRLRIWRSQRAAMTNYAVGWLSIDSIAARLPSLTALSNRCVNRGFSSSFSMASAAIVHLTPVSRKAGLHYHHSRFFLQVFKLLDHRRLSRMV